MTQPTSARGGASRAGSFTASHSASITASSAFRRRFADIAAPVGDSAGERYVEIFSLRGTSS